MAAFDEQFGRVPSDINVSLLQNTLVVVIGVGMVGSQIARGLARCTVGHLCLIDDDSYELVNTARHALPIEYVGWNKALGLADWLPKQYARLQVDPIPRKIDDSVSDNELSRWLRDADLVVAATDDRAAQRRIGRQALTNEVAAIFPAVYPTRGGGEVIVQLDSEWPCFGCWDHFRLDTEALRGVHTLNLVAQLITFHAVQLCLGLLDPGSQQHDLLRGERSGDPPQQFVMLDQAGVPSFGSLTRRLDCPSCKGGPSLRPETVEAWEAAEAQRRPATSAPRRIVRQPAATSSLATPQPVSSRSAGLWLTIVAAAGVILILIIAISSSGSSKSVSRKPPAEVFTAYNIKVNYGRSLESMIEATALKQSENVAPMTERQFPVTSGPAEVSVVPVRLTDLKWNSSNVPGGHETTNGLNAYHEALTSLSRLGFRPATLPELLAFREQYPEAQSSVPVVELGSLGTEANGEHIFGEVFGGDLGYEYIEGGFNQASEFLAVRK